MKLSLRLNIGEQFVRSTPPKLLDGVSFKVDKDFPLVAKSTAVSTQHRIFQQSNSLHCH